LTIHNKQWHNFAASEARALGDIISESTGSIISECPGDFIGIRMGQLRTQRPLQKRLLQSSEKPVFPGQVFRLEAAPS
jgi:hypothetical protein